MKQISLVVLIIAMFGVLQTSVLAKNVDTFWELTGSLINLPDTAGYSDVSDEPLNLKVVDVLFGAKMPIKPGDGNLVITPGVGVGFSVGGTRELLYHEWAYAHSDVKALAFRPFVDLGWTWSKTDPPVPDPLLKGEYIPETVNIDPDVYEAGLEIAYYGYTVEQGFERWSHTDYFREINAEGIGFSFYYKTGFLTFKIMPYTKLDCGEYGDATMNSISVEIPYPN